MAIRTEYFRPRLEAHEYKQNGEGMCWPALIQAVLHSVDSRDGNRQRLVEEMKTTVSGGTDNDDVTNFLKKIGIRYHVEAHCSFERLVEITNKLPVHADIFASVWDRRISPGFDEVTDPPESHTVAIIDTPVINDEQHVRFYDPSTYIGGLLDWSRKDWEAWWNDGPENGLEMDNQSNLVPFDPAWIMVVGLSPKEVEEYLAG